MESVLDETSFRDHEHRGGGIQMSSYILLLALCAWPESIQLRGDWILLLAGPTVREATKLLAQEGVKVTPLLRGPFLSFEVDCRGVDIADRTQASLWGLSRYIYRLRAR